MDLGKVVKMILMHDMGEIETGDIVMGLKTATHSNGGIRKFVYKHVARY
jgi:5'-deoxynucleotidase YfbR-like HD superfamily hydrolase